MRNKLQTVKSYSLSFTLEVAGLSQSGTKVYRLQQQQECPVL